MRDEVALSYTDIFPAETAESVECLDRAVWTREGTVSRNQRAMGQPGEEGELPL